MNILERLVEDRIFSLKLTEDKSALRIRESCDDWFQVELTKDEVNQLIYELMVIRDKMICLNPKLKN